MTKRNLTGTHYPLARVAGLVALLCVAFFTISASAAFAATLSLSPNTGVYTVGQSFTARVVVNTSGAGINAADGTLSFDPAALSVTGVSKGSIFGLWTAEPAFSNTAGTVTFSGGSPTGYTGSAGTVLTVSFKAKTAGTATVSFKNGSVLAADGRGTNVLTNMSGGSYTIAAAGAGETPTPEVIEYVAPANTPAAPQITSTTHPDPSKFYNVSTAELSWSIPSGVTAMRTLLDGNARSIPTKVYDTPEPNITLSDLEEGVQYFHLQFKNVDGWGKVAHYRLAVDTEKPTKFEISLPADADLSNPVQTLTLLVTDATSEVRRFLVQLDGGEPYEYIDETGSSTLTLPPLDPGHHTVIIEAFDEAGNSLISTFSFGILAFDKPQFTEYPSEINEEVIPVIKGITRPNATVKISMTKLGAEGQTYEVRSSGSGEFTFIPEGRLGLGVYELAAVAIDQHGAQSDSSDTIRIAVQRPGYLQIGSLIVSVLSVLVPLIAMVLLALLVIFYLGRKFRAVRRGVSRESKEALAIAHKEFAALKDAVTAAEADLTTSRKTGKLTKAEAALVETLSAQIAAAEVRIAKEIGDVEDVVD